MLQLFSSAFPSLKKMQREDGPQGRARFQYYQKLAAFVFAIAQVGSGFYGHWVVLRWVRYSVRMSRRAAHVLHVTKG